MILMKNKEVSSPLSVDAVTLREEMPIIPTL
jgi:hypothetical protein